MQKAGVGGLLTVAAITLCMVAIAFLLYSFWSEGDASLTTSGYDKANRLWETDPAAAVQEYKRMLVLHDNPMFGGQIPVADHPLVYQRIIDHESQSGNARSAIDFLKRAAREGQFEATRGLLQSRTGRLLAEHVQGEDRMLALLRTVAEQCGDFKVPAKDPDEQAARETRVADWLGEFGRIPFHPSACPEHAAAVQRLLLRVAKGLPTKELRDRFGAAIQKATTPPKEDGS